MEWLVRVTCQQQQTGTGVALLPSKTAEEWDRLLLW
jgi:hypothetical protein